MEHQHPWKEKSMRPTLQLDPDGFYTSWNLRRFRRQNQSCCVPPPHRRELYRLFGRRLEVAKARRTWRAHRDAVFCDLVLTMGIGVEEVCRLRRSDVKVGSGRGFVRARPGWGGGLHDAPLPADLRDALQCYLDTFPADGQAALFPSAPSKVAPMSARTGWRRWRAALRMVDLEALAGGGSRAAPTAPYDWEEDELDVHDAARVASDLPPAYRGTHWESGIKSLRSVVEHEAAHAVVRYVLDQHRSRLWRSITINVDGHKWSTDHEPEDDRYGFVEAVAIRGKLLTQREIVDTAVADRFEETALFWQAFIDDVYINVLTSLAGPLHDNGLDACHLEETTEFFTSDDPDIARPVRWSVLAEMPLEHYVDEAVAVLQMQRTRNLIDRLADALMSKPRLSWRESVRVLEGTA